MRLTLVIPSLAGGGAERVLSTLANYWQGMGRGVTLLTYDDGTVPPFYGLDPDIRHVPLGIAQDSRHFVAGVRNNLRRVSALRAALRGSAPDAVVSFLEQTNVLTLLATRGSGTPAVVSERMDPASYRVGAAWERARRWTYPSASAVVVQTQRAADYFPRSLRPRVRVIPNPVVPPPVTKDPSGGPSPRPALIAMGRLHPQKGFDLLLRAFAGTRELHPEWSLTILGEGPSRAELEALRDRLGLAGCVSLPGRVKAPDAFLARADVFVMPSRFEGFPNALCEAMACGLPSISADCPSGPREIIRHGVDGLLVPKEDVGALAAALRRLMSDAGERRRLARRAPEVTERFSPDKVLGMWEELLGHVTRR